MAGWMTKGWAIEQCKTFFGLTDQDIQSVTGPEGIQLLLALWEEFPKTFYELPLAIARQEWFHAYRSPYWHGGFWAALPEGAHVLDYGCGTGEVARLPWIVHNQGWTFLVEQSQRCLDYLSFKYQGVSGVEVFDMGGEWRGFGRFDALICTDVFEHVPNPLELQKQLWDTLLPGGHALLKFERAYPHPGHLQDSIAQLGKWWDWLRREAEIIEVETYAWVRKPQ